MTQDSSLTSSSPDVKRLISEMNIQEKVVSNMLEATAPGIKLTYIYRRRFCPGSTFGKPQLFPGFPYRP